MKASDIRSIIVKLVASCAVLLVLLSMAAPSAPFAWAATGAINEFPIATTNSGPVGIARGPDGNLWFTEATGNKIGQITPSGTITEFSLPSSSRPVGIAAGSDNTL